MAKIGLFGGSFNPIHVGHLTIAEEALRVKGLDRVIFIPSGDPYMKDPSQLAPREARLEMTRRAVAAAADFFDVSDLEIRREGPSYTSETLQAFRALYPGDELFLILGADSILEIDRWRDPERIFAAATILALTRGGVPLEAVQKAAAGLRERYGARIELLLTVSINLSASEIRSWIRTGHAYRHLVTEPVYRLIREQGLYGADSTAQGGI